MFLVHQPIILSIESSCDDTSAAVFRGGSILANVTYNQKVHEQYGGVVPELASRQHHKKILPVVQAALDQGNINKKQLDAIAVTRGPGLLGSLLVGVSFAKGFSAALGIPLIEVNHMQAHVLAHFIDAPHPKFPFLCLTVSGGHTQIVLVKDHLEMEVIGSTIDDAAGEAFDKSGKMMKLPYPAGPYIDKYAKEGKAIHQFANPKVDGYNYSFSGLKTSILYYLQKRIKENPQFIQENRNDLCASIQKTIIDILMLQLEKAASDLSISEIAIAGGVSANSELRARTESYQHKKGWNTYIPQFQYCTDNAGMIGMAAYYKYLKGEFIGLDATPEPRMKI